jgi:hypothetical protein
MSWVLTSDRPYPAWYPDAFNSEATIAVGDTIYTTMREPTAEDLGWQHPSKTEPTEEVGHIIEKASVAPADWPKVFDHAIACLAFALFCEEHYATAAHHAEDPTSLERVQRALNHLWSRADQGAYHERARQLFGIIAQFPPPPSSDP